MSISAIEIGLERVDDDTLAITDKGVRVLLITNQALVVLLTGAGAVVTQEMATEALALTMQAVQEVMREDGDA